MHDYTAPVNSSHTQTRYFFFFAYFFIFLNYENMIAHLQETWKILQTWNKVTYSYTM